MLIDGSVALQGYVYVSVKCETGLNKYEPFFALTREGEVMQTFTGIPVVQEQLEMLNMFHTRVVHGAWAVYATVHWP